MSGFSYRYRAHLFARAWTYRLGETELMIHDGAREWSVPFADFTFIESFDVRFVGRPEPYSRHIFRTRHGRPIVLSAGFRDPWRVSDKRREYQVFVSKLLNALHAVDPDREYVHGRRLLNRAGGLGGKLAVRLLRAVRYTNPDRCADIAAWIMRRLGPRLDTNGRSSRSPSPSPTCRRRSARKSRSGCGTISPVPPSNTRRSKPTGATIRRSQSPRGCGPGEQNLAIQGSEAAHTHFSLHIANWELAPLPGPTTAQILSPIVGKNQALTDEIVRYGRSGVTPLPAGPDDIGDQEKFGEGTLGMLIDQLCPRHRRHFGRPTKLNPLFARLVRLYDCPVYGSRIIRRPDRRFGYEIVGPIDPARDARGRVDVEATMQIYASLMERWIREHPEQWLWLHRTWR
jgi:KDO2-lipid IV(A) lauroyltransferase